MCSGRNLRSCRLEYAEIIRIFDSQHLQISSASHGTIYQPIPSAPYNSAKRGLEESQGSYPPNQLPNILPRPSFSSASPIVSATNVDAAAPRSSPHGVLEQPKKKQGRPSKAEIARRQAEAAAQGKVYEPQSRRRPKKPSALAGSPLPPTAATGESAGASSSSLQTPPRETAEPQPSSSSSRRKRQKRDEHQQDIGNTRGADLETAESSGSAAPTHVAQSPSDRLRPDAKFARSTATPSNARTPGYTHTGDGSEIRDSDVKDQDPSSRTMHASFDC